MGGDEETNEPLSRELLDSVSELASEISRPQGVEARAQFGVALPIIAASDATSDRKDPSITAARHVKPSNDQEIRRVMRPITDTRLARMGQPVVRTPPASSPEGLASGVGADKPTAEAEPPQPVFASLPKIPAELALKPTETASPPAIPAATPGVRAFLLGADHDAASFAVDDQAAAASRASKPPPMSMPLPKPASAPGGGRIDEITAALLRPMLKRWVEENMQVLVTRALHREVGSRASKPGA